MVRNIQPDHHTQVLNAPTVLNESILGSLDHQIVQAVLLKPTALALDCTPVQSVDSATLNWLLAVQSRLAMQDIHFFIQNASPYLQSIFIATRLDNRLKFASETSSVELDHA